MDDSLTGYSGTPRPDLVDEPEVGVQINAPSDNDVCTWTSDVDEKRRAFVVSQMADPDMDGATLVKNMNAVCEWLKTGAVNPSVGIHALRHRSP
jgi:hypothetical protein